MIFNFLMKYKSVIISAVLGVLVGFYLCYRTVKPKVVVETKVKEKVVTVDLGYKNESYLTEEEMINGYVGPKYSELSIAEKEIWKTK